MDSNMDTNNYTTSDESLDDIDNIMNNINLNSKQNRPNFSVLNDNIHRINKYTNNQQISTMSLELEILIKDIHYHNNTYIQGISFNPEHYKESNPLHPNFTKEQIDTLLTIGTLLEQCVSKTLQIIYTDCRIWNLEFVYEILHLSKQIYTLILQIIK